MVTDTWCRHVVFLPFRPDVCPARIFSSVVIFLFQVLKMALNRNIDNYHHIHYNYFFYFHGAIVLVGPGPPHCRGFTITLTHTTLGRTPLDEWSSLGRDLSAWQHTAPTTDRLPCPRWDSNPQFRQAGGRRPTPRPRGCWDRLLIVIRST